MEYQDPRKKQAANQDDREKVRQAIGQQGGQGGQGQPGQGQGKGQQQGGGSGSSYNKPSDPSKQQQDKR